MPRKLTHLMLAFCCFAAIGPMLVWPFVWGVERLGPLVAADPLPITLLVLAMLLTASLIVLGVMLAKVLRPRTLHQPLRPTQEKRPRPPRPVHHPKDFTQRLAGYLHRDAEELAEPRPYAASKMSFWSRVGQLRWMGPKPAYLIRRLLERIREQVRGRAH